MLAADAGWCDEIDACGLDGGVAEHIRQPRDVAAFLIENDGEQMTQVVRKDFAGRNVVDAGQFFSYLPRLYGAK